MSFFDKVDYYVYTDGSCINNGKKTAKAGLGIYFGPDDPRNTHRPIVGKQTNNIAELSAIKDTYRLIERDVLEGKKIVIYSDSIYGIRCLTTYGKKCADKNWADSIPNKDLVQETYQLYQDKPNIGFRHIKAHTGLTDIHSLGNENADRLANLAIGVESCPYQTKNEKIYLKVPYARKEEVKPLGGKWDKNKKKWYIMDNNPKKEEVLQIFQ